MDRIFRLKVDGTEYQIDLRGNGLLVDDVPFVIGVQDGMVTVDGIAFAVTLEESSATVDGHQYAIELAGLRLKHNHALFNEDGAVPLQAGPGVVTAMMPGVIVNVMVELGQQVNVGDVLMILEAMKMENEIQAEREGIVTQIHVERGAKVETGQPLVTIGEN